MTSTGQEIYSPSCEKMGEIEGLGPFPFERNGTELVDK